jgi:ABC-2 type transport system ATP-binding protein
MNRALYEIPPREFAETVEELTRLLELGPLLTRPTRNLSLGERMKCELAAALLHRPRVLFLDEPTIGLDVVMQLQVRQFVAAWNARFQSTVLLTSHYMDDVQALCPRVIVIAQGTLRYDGTLAGLVERHQPLRRIRLRPPADYTGGLPEAFSAARRGRRRPARGGRRPGRGRAPSRGGRPAAGGARALPRG